MVYNPADPERGQALHLQRNGTMLLSGFFFNGDDPPPGGGNPNAGPFDQPADRVSLWLKTAAPVSILLDIELDDASIRSIFFTTDNGTDVYDQSGDSAYRCFVGPGFNTGDWVFFERDLTGCVAHLTPGRSVAKVHAVGVYFTQTGQAVDIDDIILSGGGEGLVETRSYQVVPGGLNVLAAERCLPDSTASRWHYHANDLGTIVATTDDGGEMLGAYEPDGFGNYRYINGLRPDTLGLDSKFLDSDTGLYYFGHRWYDPERGRWVSEEPSAIDGPNLYHFIFGLLYHTNDLDGLKTGRPPRPSRPPVRPYLPTGPQVPSEVPIWDPLDPFRYPPGALAPPEPRHLDKTWTQTRGLQAERLAGCPARPRAKETQRQKKCNEFHTLEQEDCKRRYSHDPVKLKECLDRAFQKWLRCYSGQEWPYD